MPCCVVSSHQPKQGCCQVMVNDKTEKTISGEIRLSEKYGNTLPIGCECKIHKREVLTPVIERSSPLFGTWLRHTEAFSDLTYCSAIASLQPGAVGLDGKQNYARARASSSFIRISMLLGSSSKARSRSTAALEYLFSAMSQLPSKAQL